MFTFCLPVTQRTHLQQADSTMKTLKSSINTNQYYILLMLHHLHQDGNILFRKITPVTLMNIAFY